MVKDKTGLLIWDWNGTLLDDTAYCYSIANEMRRERGMPLLDGVDAYRTVFRFPIIEYYRAMGYTFEKESYEDISVEFVQRYADNVAACPLQPQVRETLGAVKARGLSQILLSATGQDRLDEQIDLFGLRGYFDAVLGQVDNLAYGKTGRARAFMEGSGLAPAEVLFVGDTDHDYEVASALGCRAALLNAGHQLPQTLFSCGVPVISSLPEVLSLL